MRKILPILMIIILLSPIVSSQSVAGWSIETDKPFYFIGDTMNITIRGTIGLNYSLDLVNVSNFNNSIHLFTRGIDDTGMDIVEVELDDEYIRGGVYYLNVTVNHVHMVHKQVRIEYSEDYLHKKEHEWLRNSLAWIERTINNLMTDVHNLWSDVKANSRALFVLFVLILIIGGQVMLHVIIPVFHSWSQRKQRGSFFKGLRFGVTANQIQWHDRALNPIPDKNRPNVSKITLNLQRAGLTPEQVKVVVWDATGSPGDGDFVKDIFSKYKWAKIKQKAIQGLKRDRDVAGQHYIERMEQELEQFKEKLKSYKKEYLDEVKKNVKT